MDKWIVSEEDGGGRLDQWLAARMGVSRGEAQRLLESGAAQVEGRCQKANYRVRSGELVSVEAMAPQPARALPEEIPLSVVYEDADVLVIDKPRGMVVHPGAGIEGGTLVNAVLAYADDLSGIGGELRPGIVHRLDKDTSGLLVIAKNDTAHHSLQKQIQEKSAERIYQAILWGVPDFERAEIDAPIGRHPGDRKKMAVITDRRHTARSAVTELTILEQRAPFSFAEARLQTGRTHQIRVHCAYIGHPVVGDPVYGGQRKVPSQGIPTSRREQIEAAIAALNGQALHACRLSFDHPRTGERMEFSAAMPMVMSHLLAAILEIHAF